MNERRGNGRSRPESDIRRGVRPADQDDGLEVTPPGARMTGLPGGSEVESLDAPGSLHSERGLATSFGQDTERYDRGDLWCVP